jgi:hypothetical protein
MSAGKLPFPVRLRSAVSREVPRQEPLTSAPRSQSMVRADSHSNCMIGRLIIGRMEEPR